MKFRPAQDAFEALAIALLSLACAPLWAGTEGTSSTFYGSTAGAAGSSSSGQNTFIGMAAGLHATGGGNTFLGNGAGYQNTTGANNTALGVGAGLNNFTGNSNVFLGYMAGSSEQGSNKLYIDNCLSGTSCTYPFIFGDFANHLLKINGVTHVAANGLVDVGVLHTVTTTGSWTIGSNQLTVSDPTDVVVGSTVTSGSSGIPAGTTIVSIVSSTVSLSANATATQSGQSITISSNSITGLSSGGALSVGQPVTGVGIPAGTIVVFIASPTEVLLSHPATTHGGQQLTFAMARSQMHFSLANTDSGGFITSVLENNFFLSSGARYDGAAGGWLQRSSDGQAVIAGSGAAGYRIFANSGNSVGAAFTPTLRLQIDYNGNLGLNTPAVSGTPITHSSGAHLTAGGVWTDASSREFKEHIAALTSDEALQALAGLQPVKYNYKVDPEERHVGFIAEDVPALVATPDHKSLSPMDIVAVLTKVVSEQRRSIEAQQHDMEDMRKELAQLRSEIRRSPANR